MDKKAERSLTSALLPVATMLVCLVAGSQFVDFGPPLLVPSILAAAFVATLLARKNGYTFADVQNLCGKKLSDVTPMLLILLGIGMLIGSWMISGTIPFLIYHGLEIVSPDYLIVTAFLVTAMMSLATGTSFGSAGTIGVALMGMAQVVGASPSMCAGAVLSGAYFGDKMSPLSDTTNICAIGAGAGLYEHIRSMLSSSVPSTIAAIAVFLLAGLHHDTGNVGAGANALMNEIDQVYQNHAITLLPLGVVLFGVVRRMPPVLAMAQSCLVALLLGVWWHGFSLQDALTSAVNGFGVDMVAGLSNAPETLSEEFTSLVSRGGLYSMVGNLVMIIAAFLLAAAMELSGALEKLVTSLLHSARSTFGLIAATMVAGATMVGMTSHGGVTALVVGNLFQDAYDRKGLSRHILSRSLEDSVTIVEPLMPWTVSAIFMATTLGVSTLDYLPWAVFCYCGPIFSLLVAWTGWGLNASRRRV